MKRTITLLLTLCVLLALAACGGGQSDSATVMVINDGNFAEMCIVHNMVKELVEAETDIIVEIRDGMDAPMLFSELTSGRSDIMNSYDGTLLTTFLHLIPDDVPDGVSLYDFVNEQGREMRSVMLLDKLGINNTYTIATTREIADRYGLVTITDLAAVAEELSFGAEHDFFTEEGRSKYAPFSQFYGLNFKDARQIDINLKYAAIQNGNIDVTVVYATDGMNREADLVILVDDRAFFPEYNGALLVNTDFFDKFREAAPNLQQVMAKLGGLITDEDMIGMTYDVDLNGRSPEEVAKEFLQQKGLISG